MKTKTKIFIWIGIILVCLAVIMLFKNMGTAVYGDYEGMTFELVNDNKVLQVDAFNARRNDGMYGAYMVVINNLTPQYYTYYTGSLSDKGGFRRMTRSINLPNETGEYNITIYYNFTRVNSGSSQRYFCCGTQFCGRLVPDSWDHMYLYPERAFMIRDFHLCSSVTDTTTGMPAMQYDEYTGMTIEEINKVKTWSSTKLTYEIKDTRELTIWELISDFFVTLWNRIF